MERLVFNSTAAMNEQRLSRQVLAHEMSNVNTTGFKRTYEVAMKAFKADGQGFDSRFQPQAIHTDLVQLAPGPMITSGRDLDIMMNDSTVMGVTAPNGELAFTRRGDLHLNVNGVLETGTNHVIQAEGGVSSPFPQALKSRLQMMGKFMPPILLSQACSSPLSSVKSCSETRVKPHWRVAKTVCSKLTDKQLARILLLVLIEPLLRQVSWRAAMSIQWRPWSS